LPCRQLQLTPSAAQFLAPVEHPQVRLDPFSHLYGTVPTSLPWSCANALRRSYLSINCGKTIMTIRTVGPTSTYPTIAAAVGAAAAGDIIQLEAGYSNERAVLTVQDLTVTGGASSLNI
jgi:hypothetical protein